MRWYKQSRALVTSYTDRHELTLSLVELTAFNSEPRLEPDRVYSILRIHESSSKGLTFTTLPLTKPALVLFHCMIQRTYIIELRASRQRSVNKLHEHTR